MLPGEPAFIAKKEFSEQFFAGSFMRRLGVAFVERFDAAASLADAEAVTGMAKSGRLFVFFPEGTFTRRAGLLGFYLGAPLGECQRGGPADPTAGAGDHHEPSFERLAFRAGARALERP